MRLPKAGEKWMVANEKGYHGGSKGDVVVVLEVGYAIPEHFSREASLVWWAWEDARTWVGCRGWPRRRFHDCEMTEAFREDFIRNMEPYVPEADLPDICDLAVENRELQAEVASLNRRLDEAERHVIARELRAKLERAVDSLETERKANHVLVLECDELRANRGTSSFGSDGHIRSVLDEWKRAYSQKCREAAGLRRQVRRNVFHCPYACCRFC